jgi:hypothetical protein
VTAGGSSLTFWVPYFIPVLFIYRAFSEQVEYLDLFKAEIFADELDPANN